MIRIANPCYDSVFKYLMADFKSAKILLSALLDQEVEILELLPQERAVSLKEKDIATLSVVRFDYCATLNIRGEKKKVLIELQKGKNDIDLARFRRYLGLHYDGKERLDGKTEVLPIIAIYLFGFDLSGIEPAITRFHPAGTDLVENIPFHYGKSEVVDCLTHTSYFVQLNKLPVKSKNRVSRILSVFSQHWIQLDKKQLELPEEMVEDQEIKILVDRLHLALLDHETQRQLVEEYEYDRVIETSLQKSHKEGKAEGLAEGLAEGEAKGELNAKRQTARNLKGMGIPISQIAQATGLSEQDITNL
jgi:predicted transposase/invertase (TIGR01784 family)